MNYLVGYKAEPPLTVKERNALTVGDKKHNNTGQTWGLVKYRDANDIIGAWLHIQAFGRNPDKNSTAKQKKDYANRKKNLSVEYLRQFATPVCPCCGQKFNYGRGDNKWLEEGVTPSLDCIDPKKGYVKGNMGIVCTDCNSAMGTKSLSQLTEASQQHPNNKKLKRMVKYAS